MRSLKPYSLGQYILSPETQHKLLHIPGTNSLEIIILLFVSIANHLVIHIPPLHQIDLGMFLHTVVANCFNILHFRAILRVL